MGDTINAKNWWRYPLFHLSKYWWDFHLLMLDLCYTEEEQKMIYEALKKKEFEE